MFNVGVFHPSHLEEMDPHEIYYGSLDVLRAQLHLVYRSPNCSTVTLFLEGKPEAIVGLSVQWPGNADCWTVISKKACKHPLALTKAVRGLILRYSTALGLSRLSAGTDANYRQGGRWLESLGFQLEGTMRKYGPDGSNWHLYSRIF